MENSFPHISEAEKQKEWFILLKPIIERRRSCINSNKSRLLQVLSDENAWLKLKKIIECSLKVCMDSKKIFFRIASKISFDEKKDPDEVIDEMFAEIRVIPLLCVLGFEDLRYNCKNNVDFNAILKKESFGIEVTYINGPNFKTQKKIGESYYQLSPKKLINRLKSAYDSKINQVSKHCSQCNAIIIIVTDLEESYLPWLEEQPFKKKHPIQYFVDSCKIQTIVFGAGSTLYIPNSLQDKLQSFDKDKYVELAYDMTINN